MALARIEDDKDSRSKSRLITSDYWPSVSDKELVIAFQSGDIHAFTEIYRRYFGRALRISSKYLHNSEDANEAAQETMLRALRALPHFNGSYALGAWVERIAANLCMDLLRSRARRPETSWTNDEWNDSAPDGLVQNGVVEGILETQLIQECIDGMPANHRLALVMRELEGRSLVEIGETMGISSNQVKSLIFRAKRSFKRLWESQTAAMKSLIPLFPVPAIWRRSFNSIQSWPTPDRQAGVIGVAASAARHSNTVERLVGAAAATVLTATMVWGATPLVEPSSNPSTPASVAPNEFTTPTDSGGKSILSNLMDLEADQGPLVVAPMVLENLKRSSGSEEEKQKRGSGKIPELVEVPVTQPLLELPDPSDFLDSPPGD